MASIMAPDGFRADHENCKIRVNHEINIIAKSINQGTLVFAIPQYIQRNIAASAISLACACLPAHALSNSLTVAGQSG